jgi:hypothetical protein
VGGYAPRVRESSVRPRRLVALLGGPSASPLGGGTGLYDWRLRVGLDCGHRVLRSIDSAQLGRPCFVVLRTLTAGHEIGVLIRASVSLWHGCQRCPACLPTRWATSFLLGAIGCRSKDRFRLSFQRAAASGPMVPEEVNSVPLLPPNNRWRVP